MRRIIVLGISVPILVWVLFTAVGTGANPTRATAFARVTMLAKTGPSDLCSGDACVVGVADRLDLATPAGAAKVDTTVSATFAYHVSVGDSARMTLVVHGPSGNRKAAPGTYPLSAVPRRGSSTTLTWVIPNLPAAGASYSFELVMRGVEGSRKRDFSVSSSHLAMVAEAWG